MWVKAQDPEVCDLVQHGAAPSARAGAAVATHTGRLFLFGGADENKAYADLSADACRDTADREKRSDATFDCSGFHYPNEGPIPCEAREDRAAHGLAGRYVLEFEQMLWVELTPNGAAPAARWGHSLCGSAEPIFTLAVSPGRTGAGRRQFAWVLPVGGKAAGTRTSW